MSEPEGMVGEWARDPITKAAHKAVLAQLSSERDALRGMCLSSDDAKVRAAAKTVAALERVVDLLKGGKYA